MYDASAWGWRRCKDAVCPVLVSSPGFPRWARFCRPSTPRHYSAQGHEKEDQMTKQMHTTPLFNLDLDKTRLAVDNKRLSALICALLKSQGGTITIPKEIAETVWERANLQYMEADNGDLMLVLDEGQSRA